MRRQQEEASFESLLFTRLPYTRLTHVDLQTTLCLLWHVRQCISADARRDAYHSGTPNAMLLQRPPWNERDAWLLPRHCHVSGAAVSSCPPVQQSRNTQSTFGQDTACMVARRQRSPCQPNRQPADECHASEFACVASCPGRFAQRFDDTPRRARFVRSAGTAAARQREVMRRCEPGRARLPQALLHVVIKARYVVMRLSFHGGRFSLLPRCATFDCVR